MPQPAPQPAPDRAVIDAAKASILAYNDKNWDAARASLTADCVYDEVATARRVQGVDEVITLWQGWAAALPDSRATFENACASGNTVTLELTWRGTHTGPLAMESGEIAPTGRSIEIRACQVIELAGSQTRSIRQYFDIATMMRQLGAA